MLEITGSIEKVIFKSNDSSFVIATFQCEEDIIIIKGNIPDVAEEQFYQLLGDFEYHNKYGEQFKVVEAKVVMPKENNEIITFLSSKAIKGIGREKAKAIVEKFGAETLKIIENEPRRLLEVKDIGEKTLEKIIESFESYGNNLKIFSFFQGLGFTAKMTDNIYKTFKEDAIEKFQNNPYDFIDKIKGLGFTKVDKIAVENGIAIDDTGRIKSGILHILNGEANNGSSYMIKSDLVSRCKMLLKIEEEKIEENIRKQVIDLVLKEELDENECRIYTLKNFHLENKVARKIFDMEQSFVIELGYEVDSLIKETEKTHNLSFSTEQKQAIKECLTSNITVITGGPGTGKTTIIKALMHIFEKGDLDVGLIAPTGRAAKRIQETTSKDAKTIHRILEYYSDDMGNMKFNRNEKNKLDEDVFILDEASMIDLQLMNSLLDAIDNNRRLIIVGDEDQLPSVNMGNVLRDIIDCGKIKCFRLKEIFRQAQESEIVVYAHQINNGIKPEFANDKQSDMFYIEKFRDDKSMETIQALCEYRLDNYFNIRDKIRDIQVISPSKKGELGTENLNKTLQSLLNPPSSEKVELEIGDMKLREFDKVMHIKNNYAIQWFNMKTQEEGVGIFNGEVGIIKKISKAEGLVYILFDDEKMAVYDYEDLKEIMLGYCITVHKSQGSEFPIVLLPLFNIPRVLGTRNLIYTAITRGKEGVILVGDRKYLDRMIDNNSIKHRNSTLSIRIKKIFEQAEI